MSPRTLCALVVFALLSATPASANGQTKTEIGEINGAAFRIDVPSNWNGGLVLYCHGYSIEPVNFNNGALEAWAQTFLDQGFALAQSGYAETGWAVAEAANDSMELKRYFETKYGPAKQAFVTGHSMGGLITVLLSERYPTAFAGALPMCGVIGPALEAVKTAFDIHVVFDALLPGVLPEATRIPRDFKMSPALVASVFRQLQSNPDALKELLAYTGLHDAKDLAGAVSFETYVLKDLYARAGGNPFDNRSTIYAGVGDNVKTVDLNRRVKRYAADPKAVDYLRGNYSTTGKLTQPMLAVHTTYDTLVPQAVPNAYAVQTQIAGSGNWFVQEYVPTEGHCAIDAVDVNAAFQKLRRWVDRGQRPEGGEVRPVQGLIQPVGK